MGVYKTNKPTKDGRKYFFKVSYRDIYGKRKIYVSKSYMTKKEALNQEAIFKINQTDYSKTTGKTIKELFYEFLELEKTKVKKTTILADIKEYNLLAPIHNIKIKDISINIINKLRQYLTDKKLSCSYKNKVLGLLRRLISYSNKYYGTSDSILKFIENYRDVGALKKEMDFFTIEEYQRFRSVIDDFDWLVWFDVLFYLGLRCGEAQALTFKDIDFNKNEIRINKTLTTKIKGENWTISAPKTKNSIRVLPLSKNLSMELKTMLNNAKRYKNYSNDWFVFGNSVPFKETTICLKKNKYCDISELRHIRIHDFRHSCTSMLIHCGASITLVSKYLGHSSIKITLETYNHLYESELTEVVKFIDNL